jgi:hypothetical protein
LAAGGATPRFHQASRWRGGLAARGARAQQVGAMRRIGFLMPGAENDEQGQLCMGAFRLGLASLGWIEGRNVRID